MAITMNPPPCSFAPSDATACRRAAKPHVRATHDPTLTLDEVKRSPAKPRSTGAKIADRLERSGENIATGLGNTLEGLGKTAVSVPIILTTAAGDVLVVSVGTAVTAAEGIIAGGAFVIGAATGLAVDLAELVGKAFKGIGRGAEAVGDAAWTAVKAVGNTLDSTTKVVVKVIKGNNKQIPKAFDKGYEVVSPKEK